MKTYNEMWYSHNKDLDIEVRDDDMPLKITHVIKKEDLDPKLYIVDYGKHQGKSLRLINEEDPAYIDWLRDNNDDMLMKQCIMNL